MTHIPHVHDFDHLNSATSNLSCFTLLIFLQSLFHTHTHTLQDSLIMRGRDNPCKATVVSMQTSRISREHKILLHNSSSFTKHRGGPGYNFPSCSWRQTLKTTLGFSFGTCMFCDYQVQDCWGLLKKWPPYFHFIMCSQIECHSSESKNPQIRRHYYTINGCCEWILVRCLKYSLWYTRSRQFIKRHKKKTLIHVRGCEQVAKWEYPGVVCWQPNDSSLLLTIIHCI